MCLPHCATCVSATNCTSCWYNRHGITCQLICPPRCSSCVNASFCTACENGYVGHLCNICLSGYFQSNTSPFTCSQCPNLCSSCNSTSNCFSCVNGYQKKCHFEHFQLQKLCKRILCNKHRKFNFMYSVPI